MPEVKHGEAYYLSSDIDWFCRINRVNIHVASKCHRIPSVVERTLQEVYPQVSGILMNPWDNGQNIWYNEEIVRSWLRLEENEVIARYLLTFTVMARKGFYSFAPITTDPTDGDYFLMAKPSNYVDWEIRGIHSKIVEGINVRGVGSLEALRLEELMRGE